MPSFVELVSSMVIPEGVVDVELAELVVLELEDVELDVDGGVTMVELVVVLLVPIMTDTATPAITTITTTATTAIITREFMISH